MLHVVSSLEYPYGLLESGHVITARDLENHTVHHAQELLNQTLLPCLDGIAVTRLLRRGNPAREICDTAAASNTDLIVMAKSEYGALYPLLLGSVTAKVLHNTECPVWACADSKDTPAGSAIEHILCAVELNGHSHFTVKLAAELAASLHAVLTLVHIANSAETWGPGGSYIDPAWKATIVGYASEEVAKLQREMGTDFAVIIDCGNTSELLNGAAEQTKADVLVIGHIPGRSHLGDNGNGYGIISQSRIPVLSVGAPRPITPT